MRKESKATGIKTWPEDDRPREKLLKKGALALSNSEFLAILLSTGTWKNSYYKKNFVFPLMIIFTQF